MSTEPRGACLVLDSLCAACALGFKVTWPVVGLTSYCADVPCPPVVVKLLGIAVFSLGAQMRERVWARYESEMQDPVDDPPDAGRKGEGEGKCGSGRFAGLDMVRLALAPRRVEARGYLRG